MLTALVTLLLLATSFAVVLAAKRSRSTFGLTPLSSCSTDVVASALGEYAGLSGVDNGCQVKGGDVVLCWAVLGQVSPWIHGTTVVSKHIPRWGLHWRDVCWRK